MIRKGAVVQGLTRRRVLKLVFGTQIPASVEALIEHARVPRGLIAMRYVAKSEGA
jgi:hypothetical protein